VLHGLAEHSGRYERTGSLLADAGLETSALDLRGFGRSGGRRAYVERWSVYLDDLEERLAATRAGTPPGKPVVLLGHSYGGLIALSYALDERPRPDLLVLSAPSIVATIPMTKQVVARALSRIRPTFEVANGLDGQVLSRDPAVGRRYHDDPLMHHSSTARLGAEAIAAQRRTRRAVDRLDVPTLVVHGGLDTLVPTRSTAPLGDVAGVRRVVYPDLRHEVFNEPEGPQVVGDVVAWIRTQAGPGDAFGSRGASGVA
jgi:alpha-beta hydrolase superfamily lysophospholipase